MILPVYTFKDVTVTFTADEQRLIGTLQPLVTDQNAWREAFYNLWPETFPIRAGCTPREAAYVAREVLRSMQVN